MKTLYILRHAKSSWNFTELPDEQRPLMEKGKKRTRRIIEYMLSNNIAPDVIVSSHAVRAFDTATIVAHGIRFPVQDILISHNLYHCDTDGIFEELYPFDDTISSVMLVGHNPTLTNFLNKFFVPQIDYLPTSGFAGIRFETDRWGDLSLAKADPFLILFPKEM